MNRILADAAPKRTERMGELEREVAELRVARNRKERIDELERKIFQRATAINEMSKHLADVAKSPTNICVGRRSWIDS